jgi:hypothetical protein
MPTLLRSKRLFSRSPLRCGFRPHDQPLRSGQEPPLGAHIVTPRRAYTHHGIYAGRGTVLQYGGGVCRGRVEEVPLRRFSRGREIWIRPGEAGIQDRPEVVLRARSRLGEECYHVLRNNCEHFCEWCARGQPRSYQVDALLSRVGIGWLRFVEPCVRIFREHCVHAHRSKPSSAASRYRGFPQVGTSLWPNEMITAEATERTRLPPACSVTWPAGHFSTRRPFILSTQVR